MGHTARLLGLALFVMAAVILKDNVPRTTLIVCAVIVFLAELSGRIAFHNLWQSYYVNYVLLFTLQKYICRVIFCYCYFL